jgi:AraC family transcriptional regulator
VSAASDGGLAQPGAPVLRFAEFLGTTRREAVWDGFSFSEVVDRSDQNIPLHTHAEAHFFLLLRGRYVTSAKGADDVCGPASLLFLPRWTTHQDHFRTRGGSFFTVSIRPDVLSRVTDNERLVERPVAIDSAACKAFAYKIYSELDAADDLSPTVMAGLTLELLASAFRLQSRVAKQAPRWMRGACEELQDRCSERVTVRELAQTAGVHPLHFARTFRTFHRCSPGEYLRRCRLERASSLLSQSRLPIAEVALRCGFSDQSQLTKAFRRYAGLTPAQFRRSFRD